MNSKPTLLTRAERRLAPITVSFGNGFEYSAPAGKAKPARLKRIFDRLQRGLPTEAALVGMTGAERMWLAGFFKAHEEWKREQAKAKVEAWKAENVEPKTEGAP